FGEEEAGGEIEVVARRPHRDRDRLLVELALLPPCDADLQRLLNRQNVFAARRAPILDPEHLHRRDPLLGHDRARYTMRIPRKERASMAVARAEYPIKRIIFASSLGTMIEWYDFYIFGSLATVMSALLFPGKDPTWDLIKTWALFATGFIVRPFGALVFGRIGDLIGRKYAFLVTLTIMGLSTFLIGLLPTYAQIGVLAPIILLVLRLLQGLALGGEYGGAAVYVAEHVPDNKRGFYTSFIQITATLGLFVSLGVVLGTKSMMTDANWKAWGWRIPFLLSIILVAMSLYIRLKLKESPLYASLKSQGKTSLAPLKESFGTWANFRVVLLVLFGATAGQGIVWYTGQFYALSFLQTTMK